MRNKAIWVWVCVVLGGILTASGCSTTATDIAESYGVLDDEDAVSLIQSGQAETMIAEGHARVRHREVGRGDERALVTEYLIEDEIYRIEVRKAINPITPIADVEVHSAEARRLEWKEPITGLCLMRVLNCLRKDSYDAKPTIAYRAWQGLDGTLHGIRIIEGEQPDWQSASADLNLYIRTKIWPMNTMWFRHIDETSREPMSHEGGRWVMESPGPNKPDEPIAEKRYTFINLELLDIID